MTSFLKKCSALLLLLLIPATVFAQAIPEKPTGYVTDLAEIFNDVQEAALTTQIKQIENALTVEIAIITIAELQGQEYEDIDTLANVTFNRWGIGRKDTDNGILFLVAVNDRKYRIETGEGIEGAMTAYQTRKIAEAKLVPQFRAGNYFQGISDAITDIQLLISKDPDIVSQYPKEARNDFAGMSNAMINIVIILAMIAAVAVSGFLDTFSKKHHNKFRFGTSAFSFILAIALFIVSWIAIGFFFLVFAGILFVIMLGAIFPGAGGRGGPGGIYFGGGGGFGSGGFSSGGFGGFGGGFSSGGGFGGSW